MSMTPMKIEEFEALTKYDRVSASLDGTEVVDRPLFPMTESEAGRLLSDCGLKDAHRWLRHYREKGEIAATEDAWGRAAVEDAWRRIVDLGSVGLDVFACHALDVNYHAFWVSYLAACNRVRDEFGDLVPVAGHFGRHELVSFESFVKVFYPPVWKDEGMIPGRVEFRLTDETRAAFEAAKAGRR